jgi:peptidoglycan/xylan/chitin deacetylase (PgdA/CDA1 family)
MYHSIGGNCVSEAGAGLYCVPTDKFREQMTFIKQGLPPNVTVPVITFDDGLVDNFTNAYPILKELGLKAYFFVIADKIGTNGYMDWKQLKELSAAGMVIGSHGMTHRILTGLNIDDLAFEVWESKKIIEGKLNSPVEYFSAPKGYYNKKVAYAIKRAGYKKMFTSDLDKNKEFGFGRIAVRANWSEQYFKQVVTKGIPLKGRIINNIKKGAKKLLGNGLYHNFRQAVLSKNKGKEE